MPVDVRRITRGKYGALVRWCETRTENGAVKVVVSTSQNETPDTMNLPPVRSYLGRWYGCETMFMKMGVAAGSKFRSRRQTCARAEGRKSGSTGGGERLVRAKSAPEGEPETPFYTVQTLQVHFVKQ